MPLSRASPPAFFKKQRTLITFHQKAPFTTLKGKRERLPKVLWDRKGRISASSALEAHTRHTSCPSRRLFQDGMANKKTKKRIRKMKKNMTKTKAKTRVSDACHSARLRRSICTRLMCAVCVCAVCGIASSFAFTRSRASRRSSLDKALPII